MRPSEGALAAATERTTGPTAWGVAEGWLRAAVAPAKPSKGADGPFGPALPPRSSPEFTFLGAIPERSLRAEPLASLFPRFVPAAPDSPNGESPGAARE